MGHGRILVLCLLPAFVLAAGAARGAPARTPHPSAVEAYRLAVRGDLEAAILQSDEALVAAPEAPVSWRVRGFVLSAAALPDLAADAYREAIRLDAGDAIAHNNLGTVLLATGDLEGALAAFEQALAVRPSYADARNNRGVAFERLGRRQEAENEYRAATRLDGRHAEAFNNLGALQLARGDLRAASASFSEALALNPAFAAPSLNLALISEGGRVDADLAARLEAAAAKPGASVTLKVRALAARAAVHAAALDYEQARTLYLAALELRPGNPAVLNNLAVVEDQLGLDRDALLHLTDALDADPDLLVARNNIGIVHVHRGSLDLAESAFADLLRDAPRFHRAHYNLGVIQAAQGRVGAAQASFQRAAELAPSDADVQYNLALLSAKTGGSPMAERRGYERALALDDSLAEAHLSLGTLLADPSTPARVRDPVRARRHLRRFLALARPTDEDGRMQADAWLRWLEANPR